MNKLIAVCGLLIVFLCGSCTYFNGKLGQVADVQPNEDALVSLDFNEVYSSLPEAEDKLIKILESKYGKPGDVFVCYMYYDELVDFVLKEPKTIDYPFVRLQKDGYANVVSSDDGNLRLYYWDNGSGGTWISWSNICQFRSNGKVYAYEGSIMDVKYNCYNSKGEGNSNCAILGIKTIYDSSNSPIYLVHAYIKESSNWGYASIEAIKIVDNKLVSASIFNGGIDAHDLGSDVDEQREKCYRGVEYTIANWYFRANNGEGWDWLFQYDDQSSILYVPQADPELSDRYSLYRYNGDNMFYVGTDGGFWLHPSIRSFEFLETVFETKDYRIRIDKMFDGTYRYSSWNNRGAMNLQPDIILYDGSYNEDTKKYCFKKGDYNYYIKFDCGECSISVEYKRKQVLYQENIK